MLFDCIKVYVINTDFFYDFFIDVGKNNMIGEIKVALKKEMKTEGEQLVLEILQCRNITYKFKSPDHLPGNGEFTKAHIAATDSIMHNISILIRSSLSTKHEF